MEESSHEESGALRKIGVGLAIMLGLGSALAQSRAVLELPHGSTSELASPDRRQVLCLARFPAKFEHRSFGYGTPLPGKSAGSSWSAYSWGGVGPGWRTLLCCRQTMVADHNASDSTRSYIYGPDGTVPADLRATLASADAELQPYAVGHVYVDAEGWIDSQTVRVSWFEHTEDPVRCFAFRYSVSVQGKVRRLAKHWTSPTTATFRTAQYHRCDKIDFGFPRHRHSGSYCVP